MSSSHPSRAKPGGRDGGLGIFPAPLKTGAAVLVLCLGAVVGALAAGGIERSTRQHLREAEALVNERQYNEAILLLSRIVKDDPEAFEAAEKLMQRIRSVRGEYNDTYQELLVALFEDNDLGRALELIGKLQALDPNPSATTARALNQAREAAELVYNLNLFRELMAAARVLLDRRQYRQAVDRYLEGFSLSRETFDRAGYGNIVVNAVNRALERMQAAVPRFFEHSALLEQEIAALERELVPPDREPAAADVWAPRAEQVREQLESLAEGLAAAGRAGAVFQANNAQLMEAIREGRPDLFLFIATRLVLGREDEPPEGIAAAMEAVWSGHFSAAEGALAELGDEALARGLMLYGQESYPESLALLSEAEVPLRVSLELQALWPLAVNAGRPLNLDPESLASAAEHLPGFLLTRQKLEEQRDTQALIEIATRLEAVEGLVPASDSALEAARRALEPLEGGVAELLAKWGDELQRYRRFLVSGLPIEETVTRAEAHLARIDEMGERIAALDAGFFGSVALQRVIELDRVLADAKRRFDEGVALQEGREVAAEPIRDEAGRLIEIPPRMERFPTEALNIYRPVRGQLAELAGEVQEISDRLSRSPEYLAGNRVLQRQVQRLAELEQGVAQFRGDFERRYQEAERDAVLAASRRQEGLLRLSEARANYQARAYVEARENLEIAREAFDASLLLQEDPEVRRLRDVDIAALLRRIVEQDNERVVREVRELINRGKDSYRQGDFVRAEQALLQAQARWNDTNPQEEPEITVWLRFVRAALAATTGREVPLSDPLYPEMNQLYNQALADYLEGRRLVDAGRRREAVELFNRAQDRLTQILKFFPYNRDARLLALRIDQVRDPEGFVRQLTDLFNQAVAGIGRNNQEAYAILKDIEVLQPRYPGLERALLNVEVALGIRQPPPDPVKLAQARERFDQGQSLWNRQLPDLYPAALNLINEAIALNPDYDQAVVLKDRLQLAMGGTVSTPLTSADQRLKQLAQEKFIQSQYFEALALVKQLLRNPLYQNDPELQDLERRILSRL